MPEISGSDPLETRKDRIKKALFLENLQLNSMEPFSVLPAQSPTSQSSVASGLSVGAALVAGVAAGGGEVAASWADISVSAHPPATPTERTATVLSNLLVM